MSMQVRRMKLQLEKPSEDEMVAVSGDNVRSFLADAFKDITSPSKRSLLKQRIVDTLVSEGNSHRFNVDESEGNLFTERVCTMLDAEAKKMSGNDKQVRFDFRMKRLALAHFLEFGKSGYK